MNRKFIPYSTQTISQEDIDAVASVLRSGWLTGGDTVKQFETEMQEYCGVRYGAAVCNGTAALHAVMRAIALKKNDEVIVPTLSFAASANAILYEQGRPVFCDVHKDTLLIDTNIVENLITSKTKAVIAVDYGGQPCNYHKLNATCQKYNLTLIADSCHSLGAESNGQKSGSFADLNVFSFHPVKQITTGEGGMVMTNSQKMHDIICRFRNHSMSAPPSLRHSSKSYYYDIDDLGYNYRLTDIQSALGLSQLKMLDDFIEKRHAIAAIYDEIFFDNADIEPLGTVAGDKHAYHLYVVRVPQRDRVFSAMRDAGVGVNVHYLPIHLHNLYRRKLGTYRGLCPVAEDAYASILSLPIYPGLTTEEQHYISDILIDIVNNL